MSTSTTNGPHLDRGHQSDRSMSPTSPTTTTDGSVPRPSGGVALDLSLSQIIGGSLAAATAAALGSRLGVVGTISGAALVSVVASVAGALYTASLRRTQDRVASALGSARPERTGGHQRPDRRRREERSTLRRVLVGAVVVFALTAAAVTGVELVTGRSLEGTSGTTVGSTLEHSSPGRQPTAPADSPVSTPTPTPRASSSPSPTPTPSASATPTGTPSPTATATGSPTATTTQDPTPTATSSTSVTPSSTPETPGGVLPGPDGR